MQEHEYYNMYHAASRAGYEAQSEAQAYALKLMIEHLYTDHNMKVRDIAKKLCSRQTEVSMVIKALKEREQWYNKGVQILDTAESVEMYRLLAIKSALKLESIGLKGSRGSVAKLARQVIGSKTRDKKQLLIEYTNYLNKLVSQ